MEKYSNFDILRLPLEGTAQDQLGSTGTTGSAVSFDTLQYRFGTASAKFDGSALSYIDFDTDAKWSLGVENFSVDFWVYPTVNANATLFSIGNTAEDNLSVSMTSAGALTARLAGTVSTLDLSSADTKIITNRWSHIALVRAQDVVRIYLNGSMVAGGIFEPSKSIKFNQDKISIGNSAYTKSTTLTGYVDAVRLTKGVARWTAYGFPLPVNGFDEFSSKIEISRKGENTVKIVIDGEFDQNAVVAAVNEAMNISGWETWDIYTEWSRTQMVFRALNKDNLSYKYANIIYDRCNFRLILTTCEYWNPDTKAMINEAYNGDRCSRAGVLPHNTEIWIFANSRYVGLQSSIQGSLSQFNMVTEVEREMPDDSGSFPCWGYVNSSVFAYQYGSGSDFFCNFLNMPRLPDGRTGLAASKRQTLTSTIGAAGWMGPVQAKFNDYFLHSNSAEKTDKLLYGFDTNKRLALSFKYQTFDNQGNYSLFGRIFGLKIAPYVGKPMSTQSLLVDSDYFPSSKGQSKDHWAIDLPINHGDFFSNATVPVDQTSYRTENTTNAINVRYTGKDVYYSLFDGGMHRLDLYTGNISATPGIPSIHVDMTYDGQYIYATTNTGVAKIDSQTNTVVATITIGAGGTSGICWDGWGRIYAAQRTQSKSIKVYAIDTLSMTQVDTEMTFTGTGSGNNLCHLTANGIDKIVGVYLTGTAADFSFGVIDLPTNSITSVRAAWTTGYPAVPNWTGKEYLVTVNTYGSYTLNDPVTTAAKRTLMGAIGGITTQFAKCDSWMDPINGFACVPSPNTTFGGVFSSPASGFGTEFFAAGTVYRPTGSITAGQGYLRSLQYTGNQIVAVLNNQITILSNIYRNEYATSGRKFAQLLIPK